MNPATTQEPNGSAVNSGIPAGITIQPQSEESVNIWDRAVCLVVNIGCPGNSKKVGKGEAEVKSTTGDDPSQDAVRISKELMVSPELDAVRKKHATIRKYLYDRAVPSMLKVGSYMVGIGLVPEVQKKLDEFRGELGPLVADYKAAYEQRKAEGIERLGDLGRDSDYLTEAQLNAAFTFEWHWVAFSTPKKLAQISPDFFEQQKKEQEQHWKQATEQMQSIMRAAMKELVDHMVDRLTPGEDGKKKTFHASSVEALSKFLLEFDLKDITNDTQLKAIADQAQALLGTVTNVKSLRNDDDLRNAIRAGMANVQAKLDALVVTAGSRAISLDDEGGEQ